MKPLKTKKLLITPMTDEELGEKIAREKEAHMSAALREMLDGCRQHPQDRDWYTGWRITLQTTGEEIGSLGFHGVPEKGQVEIGYGIEQAYQRQGLGTEAVRAAVEWAFSQTNVYFVTAEAEEDNLASVRLLEKLQFAECGRGEEGVCFEKEKPASVYLPIFMCLFMSVGLSIGAAMDHMAMGSCFGIAIGFMLGAALDASDKKKREEMKKEWQRN
ncbi:GNAT family N-acetyltransferase [Hominibacterium faecale]|uniref:GNAT family N-acetyltransferase n=1 Tax=Hominibacterium faecale TaxID=2839743 RepID=UPI0022B2A062|nr:GNAT family N-acetyltransferase [Hominibacterium faecale]